MRAYCVLVAGLIAGLFSGCAVLDRSIDERFDSVDRSAGKSRSEAVLRNIARASENIPLTFIAFQKVSGALTAAGSAASPSFSLGPHVATTAINRDVSISNTTLGGSASATASLDFTVLETGEFYRALLDPGDLLDFNTLVQQGYPRELLFWLFADSVRISIEPIGNSRRFGNPFTHEETDSSTPPSTTPQKDGKRERKAGTRTRGRPPGVFYEIFNRVDWTELPKERSESCEHVKGIGWLCFRDMVELAMIVGLSVKVTQNDRKEGPDLKPLPTPVISTADGAKVIVPPVYINNSSSSSSSSSSDSGKSKPISQLCLDLFYKRETEGFVSRLEKRHDYIKSDGLKKLLTMLEGSGALNNSEHFCHTEQSERGNKADKTSKQRRLAIVSNVTNLGIRITYEIKTRSTFAIYQYLGKIVHADATGRMRMTGLDRTTNRYPQILSVHRDQSTNCDVQVYVKNKHYCVPDNETESRNTNLIFSLLTQLVNLKTQSKDVGITPSVRITP